MGLIGLSFFLHFPVDAPKHNAGALESWKLKRIGKQDEVRPEWCLLKPLFPILIRFPLFFLVCISSETLSWGSLKFFGGCFPDVTQLLEIKGSLLAVSVWALLLATVSSYVPAFTGRSSLSLDFFGRKLCLFFSKVPKTAQERKLSFSGEKSILNNGCIRVRASITRTH